MSRWVSGLAGNRSFMSVPVHTGGREERVRGHCAGSCSNPAASSTLTPQSHALGQGPLLPCPWHLQKVQQQKKVCKFGERREVGGEAPLTQPILSIRGPCCVSLGELALPNRGGLFAKKASLCPKATTQGQGVKNPPTEVLMNHEPSGYPLSLSQANKLRVFSQPIPMPPTCQPPGKGYPPPQCHPERGEGGSAAVRVGAWRPPAAWPLQGPLEFPQAETRSIGPHL